MVYTDGREFDWDEHNLNHTARHRVEPDEVEAALSDPKRVGVPAYSLAGEQRWAVLGATEDGRALFVVFTIRRDKIRVITARDAGETERKHYFEEGGELPRKARHERNR